MDDIPHESFKNFAYQNIQKVFNINEKILYTVVSSDETLIQMESKTFIFKRVERNDEFNGMILAFIRDDRGLWSCFPGFEMYDGEEIANKYSPVGPTYIMLEEKKGNKLYLKHIDADCDVQTRVILSLKGDFPYDPFQTANSPEK